MCEEFEIEDKTHPFPYPAQLTHWPKAKKLEWILNALHPVIERLHVPFRIPSTQPINMEIRLEGEIIRLLVPPELQGKSIHYAVGGNSHSIFVLCKFKQTLHENKPFCRLVNQF